MRMNDDGEDVVIEICCEKWEDEMEWEKMKMRKNERNESEGNEMKEWRDYK